MNTLALNPVVSSPTVSTANLVATIVRALLNNTLATNTQASNTQTPASNTQTSDAQSSNPQTAAASPDTAAQAKLGSILNLLLNPKNGAALMDINLDQLANSSLLQNVLRQLPPELLSRPQVFEALVLQNTLLPSVPVPEHAPTLPTPSSLPLLIVPPSLTTPSTAGAALASTVVPTSAPTMAPAVYRITLEWQNRLLQVLSPQPFPSGNRLQLQTNARGEVTLLSSSVSSSTPAAVARAQNSLLAPTIATPAALIAQAPTPLQTLQQSARELLPRQQPLHMLVPLLQKFLQPSTQAQLPPTVVKAVMQLLRAMPRAEQTQDAGVLRKVVENSGSFFESRLAREQTAPGRAPDALAALFGTDIKAQLNAVLAAIRGVAPNALTMARAQPSQTDTDELVYSHKPGVNHPPLPIASEDNKSDTADTLLSQLGKLLQSGLARIQLNQLDSASARQLGNDNQPPLPTWIVDVPLRTPHGADQLQLRIEQRPARQQSKTKQQWTVHIALDLHAAGKLAATLTIAEKNVAATLWAERENTHRAVRSELDYLRAGLESVGVKVTEMQCRHGVPPVRNSALTQRLVDVHT